MKSFSKVMTISLGVILIFLFSFSPQKASAQTRAIVGVTSCTAGGVAGSILSQQLSNLIDRNLTRLTNALPPNIRRFLGLGGAGGLLDGKVPVDDSNTQDKVANFNRNWSSKEGRMDLIARCIAREVTDKMVGNILNVVRNHGRDNGPSFIKNWRNFATGGQYRGENVFRLMLTNTKLCNHFNQELKGVFRAGQLTGSTSQGGTQGSIIGGALRRAANLPPNQNTRSGDFDPYALKANCSLPAGWSMDNYQKDFSGNGGWLAFATLTKPENNILGSFNLANQEAAKQRTLEQEADRSEAEASGGYLGRRGRGASESCLVTAATGQCIVYKDVLTPGSTLQQSVAATVQQEIAWVTNADELGEVISAFTSQLLNRMLDLGSNNDSRAIDPADLPTYNPIAPGTDLAEPGPDGQPGPIDNPPPPPPPCDPNDPDCVPPLGGGSASIFGYVFEDLDGNGTRDPSEPLRSGDIVLLQTEDGSETLGTNQTFQGIYTFGQLEDGQNYRVTLQMPSGYTRTTDDSVVITATGGGTGRDFGIKPE